MNADRRGLEPMSRQRLVGRPKVCYGKLGQQHTSLIEKRRWAIDFINCKACGEAVAEVSQQLVLTTYEGDASNILMLKLPGLNPSSWIGAVLGLRSRSI